MARMIGGMDGRPYQIDKYASEAITYAPGFVATWDAANDRFQGTLAQTIAGALPIPYGNTAAGAVVEDDDDMIDFQIEGHCFVLCDAAMDATTQVVPSDANPGQVRAYDPVIALDTPDLICGIMDEPVITANTVYYSMHIKHGG